VLGLPVHSIAVVSMWVMVVLALWSAVDYFVAFWKRVDQASVRRRRKRSFALSRRRKRDDVPAI
jgi:CDP-diacylglycerol---glycerol-3-phosphate 3-phosphatidyltransferase